MANNPYYGTGYPPYQSPQQYPPAQPGSIGYQLPGYQQYTDAELEEYRRQPPYAPSAPAASQPMIQPVVQQQPLYAAAAPQHHQQQQYQQPAAVQPRPNVVFIHNTRSPGCFCLCLKAICDVIWTIIVFLVIAVLVIVGISILHRYVN